VNLNGGYIKQLFVCSQWSQNKHIQKVNSSNCYHAMIHHQNADTMGLASALMRGITPLDIRHFKYFQGGECLSNVHQLATHGQGHRKQCEGAGAAISKGHFVFLGSNIC
jgi:hypothetical protein